MIIPIIVYCIIISASLLTAPEATAGLGGKPSLGFNNCNIECCNETMPNAAFLKRTADLLVEKGLKDVGYEYVNMDDCWMLEHVRADNGTGHQIPDPLKFPNGIKDVTQHVHALGLKFGLYTAMAKSTCGGRPGSCGMEHIDAAAYAEWGVDYLKDDGCGSCSTPLVDCHNMQSGLDATGRKIFFSTESNPSIDVVSARPDKYGNTHRVGHDIMGDWFSVLSMVDIASNLWPFAHNDTGYGGYFNDLDMLEIGNPGDFKDNLDMIRVHFTMWVVLKSNLLLSTPLDELPAEVLAVVTNKEALAIHQDSWGNQGRRVMSTTPPNVLLGPNPTDATLALMRCDVTKSTQKWTLDDATGQLWTSAPSASGQDVRWCIGGNQIPWGRPAGVLPCDDPKYRYNASEPCGPPAVCKQIMSWKAGPKQCLGGVPSPLNCALPKLGGMVGEGCSLQLQCGVGETISGITFADFGQPIATGPDPFDPSACIFKPASNCTEAAKTKAAVAALCVGRNNCTVSTDDLRDSVGDPCSGHHKRLAVLATGCTAAKPPPTRPKVQFTSDTGGRTLAYVGFDMAGHANNVSYASSGPLPHSRWMGPGDEDMFYWDGNRSQIMSASANPVIDDDAVGRVTTSTPERWCVEAIHGGNLEVWVSELSGERLAVALLNRGNAKAMMTAPWDVLKLPLMAKMWVRDIWAAVDAGLYSGKYEAEVPSKGVALLVMTPAHQESASTRNEAEFQI